MTISLERTETIATDGMEMAEPTENQQHLDGLFERLEEAFPEGYDIEIIGGRSSWRRSGTCIGDYKDDVTVPYGEPIDLTGTVVDLTLTTDKFPRD
ncbi:hypothetical protein AB0G35_08845 [Streptomyces sp. NPDC021749]|uniref:hypothetical protein n=1 Tax=Streptomyces sp. NPDC021749 TaxID=3154905 RepID=UPI0033E661D8